MGEPNGVPRFVQDTSYRLLHPVSGVSAEPDTHFWIKLFYRSEKTDIALGDQIFQREPLAAVTTSDPDYEPEVS
jgi:hypothetical protein